MKPVGQMDVVENDVVVVDCTVVDVDDGVQVKPAGQIVVVDDGDDVLADVDVDDGLQVYPVGHMVVVV